MSRPTDWIALAYEQAMAIETRHFEMWAEFAGALMGAKKSGGHSGIGIQNRQPTTQELSAMGLKRRTR